ncbi:uncharacterized protein knl1 isoform X2 [Gouania willdenowi]|uniref:uncharacterized protein knl1 isoform X2 n=1 Tax=Gouania willdenowi TaxID=441366 RepID=UPI001056BD34|nr:kinetochore scaffold 1 isoform X2 [Gouania willdenowi]
MEPDPAKNIERDRYSQRRISSILKAPRKSSRFSDSEQQENVVECVKPVEKRNSRRVSFAPANDVLLYSKDVRSSSPTRNPFQEIIPTAATTQNSEDHREMIEDSNQQIVGMESILSGPVHDFQQRDNVHFNFGEKTVMFSTDEAFMDMTHSHTFNIANVPDLPGDVFLHCDAVPSSKGVLFVDAHSTEKTPSHNVNTLDSSLFMGRDIDLNVKRKTTSAPMPCVDPVFENFLASLSKPTSTCGNPADTKVTRLTSEGATSSLAPFKTQSLDKENQAPTSASTMMRKSLLSSSSSKQTEELPAHLCPEDPVKIDMSAALGGEGTIEDADPFQWLFPSQDMYAHADKAHSEMMNTKEEPSRPNEQKDEIAMINPSLLSANQTHTVCINEKGSCIEKTIVFSADEEFMDFTRSHTVNLACGSLAAEQSSVNPGFKNILESDPASKSINILPAPFSKETSYAHGSLIHSQASQPSVSKEKVVLKASRTLKEMLAKTDIFLNPDVSMDIPEAQIGHTESGTSLEDPPQHLYPTQSEQLQNGDLRKADVMSRQSSEIPWTFKPAGMEMSRKTFSKTKAHDFPDDCLTLANREADIDCIEKTLRFTADDGCMDVTQSSTVNIISEFQLPSNPNVSFGKATFMAEENAMDVKKSLTVNVDPCEQPNSTTCPPLLAQSTDGTVHFSANDGGMEVTQCLTANVFCNFAPDQASQHQDTLLTHRHMDILNVTKDIESEKCGPYEDGVPIVHGLDGELAQVDNLHREQTVHFSENDGGMEVTQCLTANVFCNFASDQASQHQGSPLTHRHMDILNVTVDIGSEKSIPYEDGAPIVHGLDRELAQVDNPRREQTVHFSENDGGMEVTQCLTANVFCNFAPDQASQHQDTPLMHRHMDILKVTKDIGSEKSFPYEDGAPIVHGLNRDLAQVDNLHREQTVHFSENDGGMEVTQCLTANVFCNFAPDQASQHQGSPLTHRHMDILNVTKDIESEKCGPYEDGGLIVHGLDRELSQVDNLHTEQCQDIDMIVQNKVPDLPSLCINEPVNNGKKDCSVIDVKSALTEVQTEHILGGKNKNEILQCLSSTQILDPQHQHLKETLLDSQQGFGAIVPSTPNIQVSIQTTSDAVETEAMEPPKLNINSVPAQSNNSPPSVVDQETCSLKSRRRSLADLQSKVRRLSHIINTAPDAFPTNGSRSPQELDPKDGLLSPVKLGENETENSEDKIQHQCPSPAVQPSASTTAPFSTKTKQLMSRLSVGSFKPKLPRRSKPKDFNKSKSEPTMTVSVEVFKQSSNFDPNVSDIFDEELASCDDMSETLDTQSPQKTTEEEYPPQEFMFDTVPVDDVFEDSTASQGQKRLFPDKENVLRCEKRMKGSTETAEMTSQCESIEYDANVTVGAKTTQTIDSSNSSHTSSSRCEATFESTFKQSLFESQLEDYASDVQKKLEDGTITVLEFFKLCNIDFVIHNPRQSMRPGTVFSGSEATTMDLLKDKHICRPKQMVYETDVNNLTEKVEKLKVRMGDLNKPLKAVNKPLWESIRYSSEKELKCFCAKLKERNNFFRKTSKAQSHEMKEVLYSNLVQANLEEQQKLRGTIGKADEMIKTLDDCISEVEKELAAAVEKGFENKPSLKSLQEEMKKTSETSTDNERQISELEAQKKQSLNQVKRLKVETRSLDRHLDTLSMLIEWKLKERTNDGTIYTFLNETMYLQLTYEKSTDKDVSGTERKIASIDFKLELDDEKSQSHARLVHALISQYVHGAPDWVKEYPTSAHIPTLLRDVGLVVSHCRLLGEECRQLQLWGSLPFDILDISCMDTHSLRKRSKFEVVFGVSLVKHLYVLKLDNFNNMIGNTTIHQLEEIVDSFTPARKVLTKIIKKIHQTLLC